MPAEERMTYPSIPVKHWWVLRDKFVQSIPPLVTPKYLAEVLGMQEVSAKTNVLPSLVAFKIIDQEGKTSARAKEWRDDTRYPEVCRKMREEIYPGDLLTEFPPPSPDRKGVERWLANRTGLGENAAGRMALVYTLLCEADPLARQESAGSPPSPKPHPAPKPAKPRTPSKRTTGRGPGVGTQQGPARSSLSPSIHIDVQIHLSPDAPLAQIEQVFASMATHLGSLSAHEQQ